MAIQNISSYAPLTAGAVDIDWRENGVRDVDRAFFTAGPNQMQVVSPDAPALAKINNSTAEPGFFRVNLADQARCLRVRYSGSDDLLARVEFVFTQPVRGCAAQVTATYGDSFDPRFFATVSAFDAAGNLVSQNAREIRSDSRTVDEGATPASIMGIRSSNAEIQRVTFLLEELHSFADLISMIIGPMKVQNGAAAVLAAGGGGGNP